MPSDVTEDAAAPKKKKKGLGSFFKVTTDKAAGPPLQQNQAIALELQSYLQTETLDAEEDSLKCWREISVYSSHKLLFRECLWH